MAHLLGWQSYAVSDMDHYAPAPGSEYDPSEPEPEPTPDFTCECVTPERTLYRVTGHDGSIALCDYCDDCADLARMDWNGETAAIEPVEVTP